MAKPLSYDALILFPVLSIVDEQLKQVRGIRKVVLILVFSYSEQNWRDEITMGCCKLHHDLAAEYLPTERLKDDVGGTDLLSPIWCGSQALYILPNTEQDRIVYPRHIIR